MVEKKHFKTKLCLQYQKGRCNRHYCNYAHGYAELRRSFNDFWLNMAEHLQFFGVMHAWTCHHRLLFGGMCSPSLNPGRQDFRGRDLRERLDRRHSPLRRYSPERDTRERHESHGDSPCSLGKRSDREQMERQEVDGHSDHSGGFKMPDGTEDQTRDKRQTSSDSKNLLDDQLTQMQSDIKKLDNKKQQLEIFLEEKVQEADSLNLEIQELEMQLSKEKVECKRTTLKIKKFIKAHRRHLRLQEELKRSQAQLKKLVELLGSDAAGPSVNEDDLNINTMSDDEPQTDVSSRKKRTRFHLEPRDISNRENSTKGDKLEKLSQCQVHHLQSSNSKEPKAYGDANNGYKSLAYGEQPRKEVNVPSDTSLPEKSKVSESCLPLPPTGMAAHAVDEDVEVVEMEEKAHVVAVASAGAEPEVTVKIPRLLFLLPPLPLIPQNVYIQYMGDDENVDINGPDEEMVEVDIV